MSEVRADSAGGTSRRSRWQLFGRWLQPGLGVKRWLALLVLGIALLGLSFALLLEGLVSLQDTASLLASLGLGGFPPGLAVAALGAIGLAASLLSIFRLNRSLLSPFMRRGKPMVEEVARHRRLGKGPKIVAIGGGTGLSTLLRGLKHHSGNLTAIVTMADDGGSSGRLRRSLGLPPPGDLRSCLAALSEDEHLLTQLFQYRFVEGEELDGHSFGNLFIAAISGVTGSFDLGIQEAGRVLGIQGRVLPSTLSNVLLVADKTPELDAQAVRVEGESRIPKFRGQVRRLYLEPSDPPAYPEAVHALLNADLIVIGPGSLYTSIIPNLLVPDIAHAVRASRAFRIYVCNVATQAGETDGYDCEAHSRALEEHAGPGLVDLVVANDCLHTEIPGGAKSVCPPENGSIGLPVYLADLVDDERPWRHDSIQLADSLIALLEERTGPLDLPKVEKVESASSLN
jgi:uncharacterized cofD-like protein